MSMLGELTKNHSFIQRTTEQEWDAFRSHFWYLYDVEIKKALLENGASPVVVENIVEVEKDLTIEDAIAMLEKQGYTVSKNVDQPTENKEQLSDRECAMWAVTSLLSFPVLWIMFDIHFLISVVVAFFIGLIPVVLELDKKPVDTADQNLYN